MQKYIKYIFCRHCVERDLIKVCDCSVWSGDAGEGFSRCRKIVRFVNANDVCNACDTGHM